MSETQTVTTLRQWLTDLSRENGGGLTPETVREAARPIDSLAHAYVFNATPAEAAEAYYLERAHRLIQTVKIRVETSPDEKPVVVRFYQYVTDDDGSRVYVDYDALASRPNLFDQVRNDARRRLREATDALDDLERIAPRPEEKKQARAARTHARSAERALQSAAAD